MKIFIVKNRNQKIIAIFPFTSQFKMYCHFLPIEELSIFDQWHIGFYNFLIDPNEDYKIIFKSFIDYLRKRRRIWNIIKFPYIPENEEIYEICKAIFSRYFNTGESETETLVIDCDRDFEEIQTKDMKKSFLKYTRKKIRRLKRRGELKFIEMREEQEIEKGLKYFYDIEDKNWKGRKGVSLKRTYHGELYKKLAFHYSKENRMRLYLLQLNDEYIAGHYAIIDGDVCYFIKAGYNEDFFQYSPSTVLYYLLFENLFRDKEIKKIDFFGDYVTYQKHFGKMTRKRFDFIVYNNKFLALICFVFSGGLTRLK